MRQNLEIPIHNNTELVKIEAHENTIKLSLKSANGIENKYTRRLVLATGHDGIGEWWSPDYLRALPEHLQTKAARPIEFNHLDGKK